MYNNRRARHSLERLATEARPRDIIRPRQPLIYAGCDGVQLIVVYGQREYQEGESESRWASEIGAGR